ncbi:ankyrin repeat and MYND domain-containing protein 1 isoform X2 [Ciona intestinalis]
MPSISPDGESIRENTFLRLITSSDHCGYEGKTVLSGKFSWPSGALYEGEYKEHRRHGAGKQTWQDGSTYEGEFMNDMRHGQGIHKWASGEVYEGSFYKDHMHGSGRYTWDDGSVYSGTFYLDRKEGYGCLTFVNGDVFEGLYKSNERFGPGILTYASNTGCKVQDIGWWFRDKLIRLCSEVSGVFSLTDHDEYEYSEDETHHEINFNQDETFVQDALLAHDVISYNFQSSQFKFALCSDNTALPKGIETYSKDFEHLPVTSKLKEELNIAFFGTSYDTILKDRRIPIKAINNSVLSKKIQKHIHTHQFAEKHLSFSPGDVLTKERSNFKSKPGPLEVASMRLIVSSADGATHEVYSILKSGLVNPNVCDRRGSVAIVSAATNCHLDVVNILLDMGANINQVNDEGISALTACHIFYYPVDHFKQNLTDKLFKNVSSKKKKKVKTGRKSKKSCPSSPKHIRRLSFSEHRSPSPDVLLKRRMTLASPVLSSSDDDNASFLDDISSTTCIEMCKSDLRILKGLRIKSADKMKKQKMLEFVAPPSDGSSEGASKTSTELAFESNENVFNLEAKVTDDLIERTATLLSRNERAVSGVSTRNGQAIMLGTAGALAVWKAEHIQLRKMMDVLLVRGADPNIGGIPFPLLFFAVKASDVDAVSSLLRRGARTDFKLSDKLGGYTALHIASGMMCHEGVKIVELLLHANADPNTCALDKVNLKEKLQPCLGSTELDVKYNIDGDDMMMIHDEGITPLHVASHRDDNYKDACYITHLLLDNGAQPDRIWMGHSPLSLSIASGNDLCIRKLLEFGANASLELTHELGSALCVASDPQYEFRRTPAERIALVDQLVSFGANMLAPVKFGSKSSTGTVVDYAHWMFNKDTRISRTPYHALTIKEREAYTARKNLLSHLGCLLRESAVNSEREYLKQKFHNGLKSRSGSRTDTFLYTGTVEKTTNNSFVHDQEDHSISRVSFNRPLKDVKLRSSQVKSTVDRMNNNVSVGA